MLFVVSDKASEIRQPVAEISQQSVKVLTSKFFAAFKNAVLSEVVRYFRWPFESYIMCCMFSTHRLICT